MSTVDLGVVTQLNQLADAASSVAKDGRRLLIDEQINTETGEVQYHLSAESKFARLIRNVKALITGGTSGYEHDKRVQAAFVKLIDKKASSDNTTTLARGNLNTLSHRIRQIDAGSISGNAATVFAALTLAERSLPPEPSDVAPGNLASEDVLLDHDYEEVQEFPGYETAATWFGNRESRVSELDNTYESIDGDEGLASRVQRMLDRDSSSYSEVYDRQLRGGDRDTNEASYVSRAAGNRASIYEQPVSSHTSKLIGVFKNLPRDPNTPLIPKVFGSLRETRLTDTALETLKHLPELSNETSEAFRQSLRFPSPRLSPDLDGPAVAPSKSPDDWGGLFIATLANTVAPDRLNRLAYEIDAQEFNTKLEQALSTEDSSTGSVAGDEYKGTKAADVIVAAKVLDEILHQRESQQEISAANRRHENRLAAARLNERLANYEAEVNEVFTSLDPDTQDPEGEYATYNHYARLDEIYVDGVDVDADKQTPSGGPKPTES